MMITVGARVELGARYHSGACLGSLGGDRRRWLPFQSLAWAGWRPYLVK